MSDVQPSFQPLYIYIYIYIERERERERERISSPNHKAQKIVDALKLYYRPCSQFIKSSVVDNNSLVKGRHCCRLQNAESAQVN